MAQLTSKTELTTPADDDLLHIIDVSDTTDGANGTSKKIEKSNLISGLTASDITDFDTEVANNSAVTANTAKVTNATHTGEVTGSGALTIADNVVDEANLKLDTAPTNDYILTADSTASGGMKWAEAPASSPLTTKGDLYTYDTDNARLPIGTDGQMLVADSVETTGLKWVDTGIDEININVFTGNGTWTKPAGLKYIIVEVVGGGGGGGGCDGDVGDTANSGGGGGGGYTLKKILASSLGSTETVTVGTGGAGATGASTGTAGGTSSFGSHCSATGGAGGAGNSPSNLVPRRGLSCGAGGVGTGGDVNGAGQTGPNGFNLALAGYGQVSGGGGGSMYGGGGRQQIAVNSTGDNGIGYGGGGSGCAAYNVNANYTGGAGTDGIVVVYEYMEA